MRAKAVRQQIAAILDSNGLTWSERENGYAIRFASALLVLELMAIGRQNLLTIRASVLRELPSPADDAAEILHAVNNLNCGSHFGKWAFHQEHEAIVLEYDMLADHMREEELMTALAMLARLADQQDDRLQQRFGGLRAFEDASESTESE